MLKNIYDTLMGNTTISITSFLLPVFSALLLGLFLALIFKLKRRSSSSFIGTLAILPAVVCVVIMAVNGNIGAGVAVAGTFSLVRFRSAQGSASEIAAIFIAMTVGLLTGMGFIIYAALFLLIIGIAMFLFSEIGLGTENSELKRSLRVVIPENLNYTEVFEEDFKQYTTSHRLISSKTAEMGSIFKLTYEIHLRDASSEKALIDAIRCKNGNLAILSTTVMPKETPEL
ncbi:MAG: DUF4956 domain-containing protein [Clostridiales bacterium]|nr:DUF4956 domain-containing protein [Clostridiales bacterium]MBR4820073.1 DUF4956 domain-containing protein [Clostridiales bacterium]